MWFPTHSRRYRLATYYLVVSIGLFGCTQFPRIHEGPVGFTTVHRDGETPIPVFDDEKPDSRIAAADMGRGIVARPKPFQWKLLASSAGNRDIEGITVGMGGYRTLILGSLAGHDPLAIDLTEQLARHIHKNGIILGGIEATVVRSPNPDGQAQMKMENANGVYLNRQFHVTSDSMSNSSQEQPEIRFLLGVLKEQQPQRVIHIRSINSKSGLIASSSGSAQVAKDSSEWLDFKYLKLPGNSADGTLERYISESDYCDIITFAIPRDADSTSLWETYGDSLLNLLLDEDYETRKLARTKGVPFAADRRGKKSRSHSKETDFVED